MAARNFRFDPEKNAWQIRNRGISFEQIIACIEAGALLEIGDHHNQARYPGQILYEVDVDGYVYVVPALTEGDTVVLKTIYPSRKATRNRRQGDPT